MFSVEGVHTQNVTSPTPDLHSQPMSLHCCDNSGMNESVNKWTREANYPVTDTFWSSENSVFGRSVQKNVAPSLKSHQDGFVDHINNINTRPSVRCWHRPPLSFLRAWLRNANLGPKPICYLVSQNVHFEGNHSWGAAFPSGKHYGYLNIFRLFFLILMFLQNAI